MSAEELTGDIFHGSEIARRIERESRHGVTAVGVVAVRLVDAADGEEGPSRRIAGVGDAVCGRLQEVKLVYRAALDSAG